MRDTRELAESCSSRQDPLVLRGSIAGYPVTRQGKTIARLERGGRLPSIAVMSGWDHGSLHQ